MDAAGSLPHRVSIQVRTETSDGHRGFTETWTSRYRRWPARVIELSGRDLERARQIDPRIAIDIRLRYWRDYRDDLDGGRTRVVYHVTDDSDDDRTLEVVTPPVAIVDRQEIQVLCREAA